MTSVMHDCVQFVLENVVNQHADVSNIASIQLEFHGRNVFDFVDSIAYLCNVY